MSGACACKCHIFCVFYHAARWKCLVWLLRKVIAQVTHDTTLRTVMWRNVYLCNTEQPQLRNHRLLAACQSGPNFRWYFSTWGSFEDRCLHKLVLLLCTAHFSKARSQTITPFFGAILQSACAHILSHLWQRNKTCSRKLLSYLIIRLYIKTEYACMK